MAAPASYLGQRLLALAVVAAPVVFLVADVAYVTAGNGINNGVLGGTIGVWSCFVFVWAFIGLSRALEQAAPRGALALLILAVPAFAGGGVAFNVEALHRDLFGNSTLEAALLDGDPGAMIGFFAFLPWGWLAPASFVLLGVLVWRTTVFPRWAGALTALGGVLFIAARPQDFDALAIAADVVLVAGLVPLGIALLRRASDTGDIDTAKLPVRT